uniref:Transposase (putative) gypsy type domain-containing protein n=1 Tax=Fagus sylvatica TaxID=28930 RepID=A0A2N9IBG5_FAGSY
MPPTPYHRHIMTMCGVLSWSEGFQMTLRVPRESEASFNEESSFQAVSLRAASDTCRHATGRFAENGLGPPPIEGFVSSDSVLHRLSAELYSVIYPSISTWGTIRGRMAANEAEWSLPLSEELPEGLSDKSAGGCRYQIPDDVVLRIPDPDERACCPKYEGDVAFYEADLRAGLHFPIQPFVRELLDFLSLAPGQVNPNGWRTIISCMVMWRVNSNGEEDLTVDEFLFWSSKDYLRPTGSGRMGTSLCVETTGRGYRKKILGTSSEFRRSWGAPSSFALDRPLLNSVWQERILRILDIEDRRYNIFIEPDLLATFSLGPVPSSSVRALVKANKKRVDTMKLNKNRLKQLAQSGEVAAAPISLKCKKTDEGSSKRVEEAPSRPSIPTATPSVIPSTVPSVQQIPTVVMVDSDLTPPSNSSTINQSPHVAMDRAKGAISSRDTDEYAVAHTEDLSYLMVHSLMRVCLQGLTEAMVMARRCASVEEDLAILRAKSMADEAEMKNAKRAIMELTRERKEALAEAEKLRKELKARDDDVKVAVDTKDKAIADLKHLVGQIEGAKKAAVSEFRASEAFEDINTRYFLSGFEAFRKQAVQRFPGLDFSALQPYDDEDSVVDVSQDQAGDEDVSSK